MPDARNRSDPRGAVQALTALEQRLDARSARVASGVAQALRRARRARARAIAPWPDLQLALASARLETAELAAALAFALRQGALASAVQVADRLLPGLASPDAPAPHVELVLGTLLMGGARADATALARAHAARLSVSATGAALLELVGLWDGALWLPNGRPHSLSISRRLREGSLCAEELAADVATRPWSWLRSPELLLLFHSALVGHDPERALSFLNRFLRLHQVPPARLEGPATSALPWLAMLRFPEARRTRGRSVSVVVTARNAEQSVAYAVASLLGQDHEPLEVLVCDDESDDGTLQVLRQRFGHEPRVRLFRSTRRQGAYNVRNALLARAKGELVTCHDADDVALPTRIARQVAALGRPGAVASVTSWLRFTPDGQVVFFKDLKAVRLSRVSLMLSRETFQRCGPFRSALVGADLELHAELQARYGVASVVRVAAPLILGLWSPNSATRSPGTEALEDGYRSPARRNYSELVFTQRAPGYPRISEQEVNERLQAQGNLLDAAEIVPVD